jgi:hypothetical protein
MLVTMEETLPSVVLIVVLGILALYVVPRIRMKRAVDQVVAAFERNDALHAGSARTIEELGLGPRSFLQGLGRVRDFKPYALQALMKAEVVRQTEDGRYYLSRDRLAATNLVRR